MIAIVFVVVAWLLVGAFAWAQATELSQRITNLKDVVGNMLEHREAFEKTAPMTRAQDEIARLTYEVECLQVTRAQMLIREFGGPLSKWLPPDHRLLEESPAAAPVEASPAGAGVGHCEACPQSYATGYESGRADEAAAVPAAAPSVGVPFEAVPPPRKAASSRPLCKGYADCSRTLSARDVKAGRTMCSRCDKRHDEPDQRAKRLGRHSLAARMSNGDPAVRRAARLELEFIEAPKINGNWTTEPNTPERLAEVDRFIEANWEGRAEFAPEQSDLEDLAGAQP